VVSASESLSSVWLPASTPSSPSNPSSSDQGRSVKGREESSERDVKAASKYSTSWASSNVQSPRYCFHKSLQGSGVSSACEGMSATSALI
jgi:hypothetical protein